MGNAFETSNKFIKIWLKELNSRISKIDRLTWTKIFKEKLILIFTKLKDKC